MVAETTLSSADLIWPLFIAEGQGVEEPIASLPGVSRWSVDLIAARAREARELGIPCIALFPNTPGNAPIGSSWAAPSHTNKGQMKSLGWRRCSASMARIHGLTRPRRMRKAGKLVMRAPLARPSQGKKGEGRALHSS
jgi:hypothetical protein